jgi:hypothetical protein
MAAEPLRAKSIFSSAAAASAPLSETSWASLLAIAASYSLGGNGQSRARQTLLKPCPNLLLLLPVFDLIADAVVQTFRHVNPTACPPSWVLRQRYSWRVAAAVDGVTENAGEGASNVKQVGAAIGVGGFKHGYSAVLDVSVCR